MERKPTILLVDDDRAILASFRDMLTRKGYDVDTAQTGREAIDKSIARAYNLAVIDIKLPDMEGTELLARFHGAHPRPKKIVVTGFPTMENAVVSLNVQADAYLVKPVKPEEFLRVVEEKLREKAEEEIITEERVATWLDNRDRKARERSQRAGKSDRR